MNERAMAARRTYDAFAATYDNFNHRYQYERWTGKLLERAEATGLKGYRLLDVGCGTGLSFVEPLARGWAVIGCDISPRMIDRASARAGERAALHVADMRALPRFGEFDLVWAVNDAVNYLLDPAELQAALAGMRRNLTLGGVVLFDVNTLAAYRSFFGEEVVVEREGRRLVWQGMGPTTDGEPGSIFEASIDGEGTGVEPHTHRQRHFPEAEVLAAIDSAGLECVELSGELEGELTQGLDEKLHTKAVYVCKSKRSDRSIPRVSQASSGEFPYSGSFRYR
jgi:SAM-dependent methyltransferase